MTSFIWHGFVNWLLGFGGLGGAVAIVAWVLWAVTPAILLPVRAIILQVAVGATVFAFAWSYAAVTNYKAGYNAALTAIEKQNAKVGHEGSQAAKNVRACFDKGGEWDIEEGKCVTQ